MAGAPATAAELDEALAAVRDVCSRLDPVAIPLCDVPTAMDAAVALERLGGGAVSRLAARYEESGAWQRNGARSAEDDLARKTGTGTGSAKRRLSTSKRLRSQPRTDAAIRQGALSPDQANEISDAADASPDDEDTLLDSARRESLHELRKKATEARARADKDREARRRRLHAQRRVRRWNDGDGMANLLLRLPGDEMAEIDARLKPRIDRAFADARHAGRMEPVEAYAADVVRELLLGASPDEEANPTSQAVRPQKKVIGLIDVTALNRGTVEDGETCEIAGVGPVSVDAVRSLLSDAFLTVVFTRGVDVGNVTHLGRQVTRHQRTALEARGGHCERCGSTHLVDIDHNEGWTLTHDTCLDDLSWVCWHCHQLKTRHHLRLAGEINNRWFLTRPDGKPWRGPHGTGPPDNERAARPPGDDPPPAPPTGTVSQPDLFTLAR